MKRMGIVFSLGLFAFVGWAISGCGAADPAEVVGEEAEAVCGCERNVCQIFSPTEDLSNKCCVCNGVCGKIAPWAGKPAGWYKCYPYMQQ